MNRALLILIVITSFLPAQQFVVSSNGTRTVHPSTTSVHLSTTGSAFTAAPAEETALPYIIELTAPPKTVRAKNGMVYDRAAALRTKDRLVSPEIGAIVQREFNEVFNGFAVTLPKKNAALLASLPGVRAVHPDLTVTASPVVDGTTPSAAVVPRGTKIATARGIRIGIIDTGVDYLHEAFGGFGPGHTIAGGYDLVNNDDDPMDDNGHGSHVAGIICGRSDTICGVAKDAAVFVYKALDRNGNGSSSTVIAAIERAVKDSVKVINLSLGASAGSSDDPLSVAVNRAADAGVVVVVAAGNNGDYSAITSPGTAEKALTVGAADASAIASFSSKGPEPGTYSIKPEVVAPGVNVLSVRSGGGYVSMSGTSMATPFVTALAAAMIELHPERTAAEIRDAIISSAVDLGKPLFAQGHGRVDEQALLRTSFASPSSLSFGFDTPSSTAWKQNKSLSITNHSGSERRYTMTAASTNAAVTLSCSPASVTIPANSSAIITVALEANNPLLANNSAFESGYSGSIIAAGDYDSVRVPYAFFKGPVLQLRFNEVPWMVLVHNGSTYAKTLSPKSSSLSLILKEGSYDIVTSFYGWRTVVTEQIKVAGKEEIAVNSSSAVNAVSFTPVNEKGTPIDLAAAKGTYSYLDALVFQPTGYAMVATGGGKVNAYCNPVRYFSAVSARYTFGTSLTLQPDTKTSYTYDVIADSGITSARIFRFGAGDMKKVEMKYSLAPTVTRAFPIVWTNFAGKFSNLSVTFYDGTAAPLTPPFIQNSFYTERTKPFPILHQREAYTY